MSAATAIGAIVIVFVLGIGLLYAYRSQSPAIQMIPYTATISAVQEGRVQSVVIEDGRATLTYVDGTHQQAAVPDNAQALGQSINDFNRANPSRPVELTISNGGAGPGIAPILFGLLPLLVLAALVLLGASLITRARAPHSYDALSRLADLRDRGVVTEEEFQREKRKLLK
jgi:ATP-dependent Zn protease